MFRSHTVFTMETYYEGKTAAIIIIQSRALPVWAVLFESLLIKGRVPRAVVRRRTSYMLTTLMWHMCVMTL